MTPIVERDWLDVSNSLARFGELRAKRVDSDVGLYLAVDHDGMRHALLTLANQAEAFADEHSRGLSVRGRELELPDEPLRPFLDLACTESGDHSAFNVVVSDIAGKLGTGTPATEAVRATLSRWRRFWGVPVPVGLTAEQARGLFAELWFLHVWLIPCGVPNVHHWAGPSGARHDFQWSDRSVEVKATVSLRGHIHRVNGLEQLDPPEGGDLYLFSLRLREEDGAAHSLPGLIEEIASGLAGEPEALDAFDRCLSQVGYSPLHADRYLQTRYRVVDQRLYVVANGFPRLSVSSFRKGLPRGVERVDYEINMEVCPELCVGSSPDTPGIDLNP